MSDTSGIHIPVAEKADLKRFPSAMSAGSKLILHIVAVLTLEMACGLAAARSAGLDAGNSFAVEGVYRYQSLRPAPSPDVETASQGRFTVYLAPPRWAITYESDILDPDSNVLHERVEGSFDGTNVFVVKRLNPARFAREHNPDSMLLNMASIYAAAVPPVWEREIYRLWLAFVAPSVWKSEEGVTRAPTPDLSLFHHPDSRSPDIAFRNSVVP